MFLYSRKPQLLLLLCWLLGMAFMYVQATGLRPLWLADASQRIHAGGEKARLGAVPEIPARPEAPVLSEAPPRDPGPAAHPELNRCLAFRVVRNAEGQADTLVLEMDYVAAQRKGFTIGKAHGYPLKGASAYAVEFDAPWVSDIGEASFPLSMPQATELKLMVSKTRHLRLLVHTRSMREARGARLRVTPTDTGLKAEIRFPRRDPR
jgi:hypothetical protein